MISGASKSLLEEKKNFGPDLVYYPLHKQTAIDLRASKGTLIFPPQSVEIRIRPPGFFGVSRWLPQNGAPPLLHE